MRQARTFRSLVPALVATILLLSGCSDGDDHSMASGDGAATPTSVVDIPADELVSMLGETSVTVTVVDNSFEPRYLEISEGTRVVWTNEGRNTHNIVPGVEGAFEGAEQDKFVPGATHIATFDHAGDFGYFCSIHGTMKNGQNGAIRVVAKK